MDKQQQPQQQLQRLLQQQQQRLLQQQQGFETTTPTVTWANFDTHLTIIQRTLDDIVAAVQKDDQVKNLQRVLYY